MSQKDLVEGVQKLHQQVVDDLTAYSKRLEEPKAKRARSVQADSGEATVKQEPTLNVGPGQSIEGPREELLDKNGLIDRHNLKKLEKGAYGKKFPLFCGYCSKAFCGRNRAKVLQHVSGPEHRKKRACALQKVKKETECEDGEQMKQKEAIIEPSLDTSFAKMKCQGLRLKTEVGQSTRLGSDFMPVWEIYSEMTEFSCQQTVMGDATHDVSRHDKTGDWTIRCNRCIGVDIETEVLLGKDGHATCVKCRDLGNCQKFMSRIASLVQNIDMARLLHCRMFSSGDVECLLQELRESTCY